jgi:beta-phosphoglucomutase-like phosphatase (HAD superfamily)
MTSFALRDNLEELTKLRGNMKLITVGPRIRGCASDLEGTGVDIEWVHFRAFEAAAKDHGMIISFQEMVEKIPNLIGGGDKLIAEGIARLSEGKVEAGDIMAAKMFHHMQLINQVCMMPRPGYLEAIEEMRKAGMPVVIGSLTERGLAELILERSGLNKVFLPHERVLLGDVKYKKPAPDVYIETARRMGVDPIEQVVFEDSATGVKAGVAAGSAVIAFPVFGTEENIAKIEAAGASRIYSSWEELRIVSVLRHLRAA